MKKKIVYSILILSSILFVSCKHSKSKTVKVGLLHSLTGTMAISEVAVHDAELLAIEELNEAGGVLGCQIKAIEEDGKSNPRLFEEKARKLIEEDGVATIFGCWTSDSRKAVKSVVEELYNLLWYPVQYEGFEASPNIIYTGAAPNQQVVPAVEYCYEHLGKKFYLLGSDYVFPHTANSIIKAQLKELGATCIGETYVPMHESDFVEIVKEIKELEPDVIINTLNGSSNLSFFSQLKYSDISADEIPVMSFSIAEAEINSIGVEKLKGNYVAWNYFETTKNPKNTKFISAYRSEFGEEKHIGDPVEAAYISVYLWATACERAGTFDIEPVRIAAKNISYIAPEGMVTIDGSNQHLYKFVRIGQITSEGDIKELYTSNEPVRPDPYLSTYAWARGL